MSSVRLMSQTSSLESLMTVTSNRKLPPGSGMESGVASLMTRMLGSTFTIVTVASSLSSSSLPSSSETTAVTMSVSKSPALPETFAVKEHS